VENQRNLILAVILTGLLLFGWDAGMKYLYPQANKPAPVTAAAPAPAAAESKTASKPTREGGLMDPADIALEKRELGAALANDPRVPIDAPGLAGSINLRGGMIDYLVLKRHTEKAEKDSGPQRIFSPDRTEGQQFAQFGWVDSKNSGASTPDVLNRPVFSAPAGAKLTPTTPVTVTWTNPSGLIFAITYAIDKDYMVTATQTVANRGTAAVSLQPFALINRTDKTMSADTFNVHSGPIGAFNGAVDFGVDYKRTCFLLWCGEGVLENQLVTKPKADWIGFTDIYWMSVLIPDNSVASSDFRSLGNHYYRADLIYDAITLAPGKQVTKTTRLFAGAKDSTVLDQYERGGIANFGLAIDWGWFRWFEWPIFQLLKGLFKAVGNFGVAIILLTLIVRGLMFPIAQRQFASMAAMRAIQPKMKAIQERYKDDKPKQQEEVMKLYKQEGVNPLAGCLPIFLQIPVFFALYKVLQLAIEMRHQPFLWIKDLSAPDPLHILNLFGLLPFTPPAFLAIGVLAVLLGITMWYQFKLNPAQMDPVQQQVFSIMPWIMMFIMAPFAAGLLIYWITSNILTITQQKYLYSKHPQLKAQVDKDKGVKAS
jgi:YidC/Oxa1 family membrane protein insertase